jgi:hypothetical protein
VGRRGADNINASFNHGTSADFGCMGHWGGADLGYGGAANVIENRWTHIVYTYNANTLIQNAYVDGVQVNTETLCLPLAIAEVALVGLPPRQKPAAEQSWRLGGRTAFRLASCGFTR